MTSSKMPLSEVGSIQLSLCDTKTL